jgi:tetratricopeptide (TPR) repeat protein
MTYASLSYGQSVYVPPKVSKKQVQQLHDAVLSSKAGQMGQAISNIRSIIDKCPTWTEPRQELSRILFLAGKKLEAIQELENALTIDTLSQIEHLFTLGRLYEETNQPQKAIAAYQTVFQNGASKESL